MAGAFNHYNLRATVDLVRLAEKLMDEIEAGKRIQSGSGGGKAATYDWDSHEARVDQLDDVILVLRDRAAAGDTDVPPQYLDIEPEPDCEVADFSAHAH